MATYIRRRSSSRPSRSVIEFSCGNKPSSMPVMNTQSNSSPLAACTVISCTASCPACAWLSPDSSAACVRNAASGLSVSPVSASGASSAIRSGSTSSSMARLLSIPWLAGLCRSSSMGNAVASRPKPSSVTKLSAALTSSSRFSMRSAPSRSALKCSIKPLCCNTSSMIWRSVMFCVCSRSTSILATKADRLVPAFPPINPTESCSDWVLARAASCSCSMLRAPMPRGGKLTTRMKLVSSCGFSSNRR